MRINIILFSTILLIVQLISCSSEDPHSDITLQLFSNDYPALPFMWGQTPQQIIEFENIELRDTSIVEKNKLSGLFDATFIY